MIKRIISIILCILTVTTTACFFVNAANYTTNYNAYSTPGSSDYAYWNGSKVCKASNTTKSKIQWMQASINYCIQFKGLSASKLDVDGSFGPASKKATQAFQKKYGLSVDGSFGPGTIAKMKEVLNITPPSSDYIWPLASYTKNWNNCGEKRAYETHVGTDVSAKQGTACYAIANGKVIAKADKSTGARGYYVVIEFGEYYCVYEHLAQSASVSIGQSVYRGQIVGYVGSTGNSTGPHLHFEIAKTNTLSRRNSVEALWTDVNRLGKHPVYYGISRGSQNGNYYQLVLTEAN